MFKCVKCQGECEDLQMAMATGLCYSCFEKRQRERFEEELKIIEEPKECKIRFYDNLLDHEPYAICSLCEKTYHDYNNIFSEFNYCPNCGAKIKESE